METQFSRTAIVLGDAALERLARCHVAVVGLGGVGAAAVEALARAGVGQLTLVDQDVLGPSNLNRQLLALHSTLGLPKAEAAAQRVLDINPSCHVSPLFWRYTAEEREVFFAQHYDYIVDAIDLVACKLDLITTALARNVPILSALGTGNKVDAAAFRITDISKTEGCHLARVIRKELRNRGILHHKVLFSPELPRAVQASGEAPPPGRRSTPGSVPWVPTVAGLMMAGQVILELTQQNQD